MDAWGYGLKSGQLSCSFLTYQVTVALAVYLVYPKLVWKEISIPIESEKTKHDELI